MGPSNAKHSTLPAPRILVVEDHEDLAEATAEFLRREGLEVCVVATGGAALDSVGAFRPDIVLCDLHLPDMVGFDLARALQKRTASGNPLFVIHTVFRQTDLRDVDAPEIDLFLSKPVTQEKVKTILELSKQRREGTHAGRR